MYWRFGHQNASVIDHLLETGNVSLEELLEQDDLIQECKAQNPRLIEYLRDPTVLQQLLGYIISDDLEDRARFKYPFIACEVIACEVWAIFESALSNPDMLVRFWEFLDRPAPLNPVQASYFAKVIGVFLMKKTSEMLQFIKAQPNVVSKLLTHMSTSSIMDLLLKIISMEESPDGKGTVQWLSEQGLMPWLVNQLDPNFDGEVHSIASQVLLDIIAISQSSHPEQPSIGTNILIDELKSEVIVSKLVGFMLDRNAPYSTSTLINGVTIFIELIRRNNSDYDVDPISPDSSEHIREAVDLSDLLKVLATRIKDFKDLLVVPRSVTGPIETSIGRQVPLGFERLKICEMFAELLHCSNMAILNSRPIITVSTDGTVKVPTVLSDQPLIHHSPTVKEELNSVRNGQPGDETPKEMADQDQEMKEPSDTDRDDVKDKGEAETEKKAAPEQSASNSTTEPKISNVEQLEDATATLKLDDQATPKASSPINPSSNEATPTATPIATPSSPSTTATAVAVTATNSDVLIPVGDFLKMQFVDHQIIPTCFDLFFQFPWNNFLHTVVYDMVHQVFHRPMGDIGRADMDGNYIPPRADLGVTEGWNRRLTISIFKDGQLTKRITDAQRLCDYECAQPKGVRLGYMGHLTYIADETVKLLELYSQTSLLPMLYEYMDLEDWWNYVSKVLKETKERDAQVLGGMRPNLNPMSHKSLLDDGADDDFMDDHGDDFGNAGGFLGGEGGIVHEGDVASDQISTNLPEKFGSSDEDEDDEDGNWIGEYGTDTDFERRRAAAAAASALDDPFGSRHAMDFDDSDEDEGVDEEAWNSPWPNSFGDTKLSGLGAASQFNASLTDWSEDFQDGFTEFKTASADSKNDFDMPPFSIDPSSSSSTDQKIESGSNVSTNTPAGDKEALGDKTSTAEQTTSSSLAPTSELTSGTRTQDDKSLPSAGSEQQQEQQMDVDMDVVPLAPVVHGQPALADDKPVSNQDNNSPTAMTSLSSTKDKDVSEGLSSENAQAASSATSTDIQVDLEPVPLADPNAPKLHETDIISPTSTTADRTLEDKTKDTPVKKSDATPS